jgi:hypothetical protein
MDMPVASPLLGPPPAQRVVPLASGPVRLREMTGADEELLFEVDADSGAARVTALLQRLCEPLHPTQAPDWAAQLPLGERDLLLLRLRQLDLGDAVHQVARCPQCAGKVDVDFALSELPFKLAMAQAEDGLHAVQIGDHTLHLRAPNGADQQAIEALARHNAAAANTRLFSRLVQRVEGPQGVDATPDEAAVRAWPLARRQALALWLQSNLPGPDLFLDLACPHCQADMSYVFDLHSFFLPSA